MWVPGSAPLRHPQPAQAPAEASPYLCSSPPTPKTKLLLIHPQHPAPSAPASGTPGHLGELLSMRQHKSPRNRWYYILYKSSDSDVCPCHPAHTTSVTEIVYGQITHPCLLPRGSIEGLCCALSNPPWPPWGKPPQHDGSTHCWSGQTHWGAQNPLKQPQAANPGPR